MDQFTTQDELKRNGDQLKSFNVMRVTVISLIIFIIITVAGTLQLTYRILTYDKVYKGVYVNNLHLGGLTKEEASGRLNTNLQEVIQKQSLVLKAKNESAAIQYKDIGASYDLESTVEEVYNIGRQGNIIDRMLTIADIGKHEKHLYIEPSFDNEAVEKTVNSLYDRVYLPVREASYQITANEVKIKSGTHGEEFDKETVLNQVNKKIRSGEGGTLEIPISIVSPARLSADDLQKGIFVEPKDAYYKVENNEIVIHTQIIGRDIDKSSASALMEEINKNEGIERSVPLVFTPPKLLEDQLKQALLRDELYTYTTYYDSDSSNRGINVRISASKVNGKVVAPGEVFSFNNAVGILKVEDGYKNAPTYIAGKVVDDIGGGVCQVSSTLFNAVVYSDLAIEERTNHMFIVGYVPLGQDAAVDCDVVDLKFKNTTNWPLKIFASAGNGMLTITLKGTNENPGKTVELRNQILETYQPGEYETPDPELPEGEKKVVINPGNGYYIETYKIVKQDGKVVSEDLLHVSHYAPLDKQVKVGTKKISPPQEAPQQPQQ